MTRRPAPIDQVAFGFLKCRIGRCSLRPPFCQPYLLEQVGACPKGRLVCPSPEW